MDHLLFDINGEYFQVHKSKESAVSQVLLKMLKAWLWELLWIVLVYINESKQELQCDCIDEPSFELNHSCQSCWSSIAVCYELNLSD